MKSDFKTSARISNLFGSFFFIFLCTFTFSGKLTAGNSGVIDTHKASIPLQHSNAEIYYSPDVPESLSNKLCCFLPFFEDWTTGQFDVNLWSVDDNWIMDGGFGNSQPSAKFKKDPLLTNYSKGLTSFYFNSQVLQTETPFSLILGFDIKLDDSLANGSENMQVEVLLPTDTIPIMLYKNEGDTDWKTERIDISEFALNTIFRIRFNANGESSENINAWWIDNISVEIEYHFYPPIHLQATRTGTPQNDILLTWQKPTQFCVTPGTYHHYDNEVNDSAVGNNPAGKFCVAILFDSLDLADCVGKLVKRVKFFPKEELCSYTIRIWDTIGIAYEQAVLNPVIGCWNDITLDVPYLIEDHTPMHIGYLCNPQSGSPAGIDSGPAVAGKGDLISYDNGKNWKSLALNQGIDANLNLAAFIEEPDSNFNPIYQFWVYRKPYQVFPGGMDPNFNDTTVYDNIVTLQGNVFSFMDFNLSNAQENCYNYYIRAMYPEGYSPISNIAWDCIFVSNELDENKGVKLFPNPAMSFVRMESTMELSAIEVYNSLGNRVHNMELANNKDHVLMLDRFPSGMYSVVFTLSNGKTVHRTFLKL